MHDLNENSWWCSVDPGRNGAIVYWLGSEPKEIILLKRVWEDGLSTMLSSNNLQRAVTEFPRTETVVAEFVHGIVGDGARQAYNFGFANGMLFQAMAQHSNRVEFITPMEWMNTMHVGLSKKLGTKERSYKVASNMFEAFLSQYNLRKTDDGVFDAILLGAYYWKHGSKYEG